MPNSGTTPGKRAPGIYGGLVLIEVYADVLDADAYVTQRRLAAALPAVREQGYLPTVMWRPYLTDPTAPRTSTPVEDLAGNPIFDAWQSFPKATGDAVRTAPVDGAGIGFAASLAAQWRASSWAAHRLIAAALDQGSDTQDEVVETILHAHFVAGADINEVSFLESIATRFDLAAPIVSDDGRHALVYMEPGFDPDDRWERRTREARLTGAAVGIEMSPTVLVNGHSPLAGTQTVDVLTRHLVEAARTPPAELPEGVRRLRLAQKLLDAARDPLGCLYLLAPLRPEYDGERNLETLSARALVASASLAPARTKLQELVEVYPDDAHLHHLLGRTLRRLGEDEAAQRHLTIAAAMNPDYADR